MGKSNKRVSVEKMAGKESFNPPTLSPHVILLHNKAIPEVTLEKEKRKKTCKKPQHAAELLQLIKTAFQRCDDDLDSFLSQIYTAP